MMGRTPDDTGDIILDSAYLAKKNYRMIADSSGRPVIWPGKGYVMKGTPP